MNQLSSLHLYFFLSPSASGGGGWTRTLNLNMMRSMLYHCATAAFKLR